MAWLRIFNTRGDLSRLLLLPRRDVKLDYWYLEGIREGNMNHRYLHSPTELEYFVRLIWCDVVHLTSRPIPRNPVTPTSCFLTIPPRTTCAISVELLYQVFSTFPEICVRFSVSCLLCSDSTAFYTTRLVCNLVFCSPFLYLLEFSVHHGN